MKSISTLPALTAHQLKKREPRKEAQLLRMQSWKPLDAADPLPALSELFNDAECSLYSLLAGTTTACQTKPKCHLSNQAVDHHLWRLVIPLLCSKLYYKALCPVRFALPVPGIISTPELYQPPRYYINPCIIATTLESRILLRTVWMNTLYAPYICTAMSKKLEVKGAFQPPTSY